MVAGDPALNTVHITQRQFPDQQRQTLATKPAETTVQPSTSSDQIEVQAQSTWNTKWASSIMRFKSTFLDNDFGYACSVCDRLWFRNDLEPITAAQLKEHGALDALAGPSRVSRTAVRQSEPDSAGTSSNPHDSLSTEQCRFCGEFNADCVRVSSEKPYLVHNRTAITLNGLSVDLDFSTLPNAVCPHCDEKLHDIYNFVNQVKEAQHNLINVEANREEIDIKTEAYSPTLVDDKEGLLHLVTVGETEFVKPVFTHKRKNDSELTKPRDKLQKKLKVTEKNVELFIDVKEEVDMDENSEDQMENSEFSDTGTDVKPTELELNSALRNTFSDSFS